jgi:hypothetical protein
MHFCVNRLLQLQVEVFSSLTNFKSVQLHGPATVYIHH